MTDRPTIPRDIPSDADVEATAKFPVVAFEADAPPSAPQGPPTMPVATGPAPEDRGSWVDAPSTEKAVAIAARQGKSRAVLTVLTGVNAGQVISPDGTAAFVLGRGPKADLNADDVGVSRRHAQLVRQAD